MHTQRARLATSLLALAGLLASAAAPAAVIYSEAVDGDLSNSAGSPTALGTLAVGSSTVSGALVNRFEAGVIDRVDSFSVTVGSGTVLSQVLFSFTLQNSDSGPDLAISGSSLLGSLNTHASGFASGNNLLAFTGFSDDAPLGAGTYSFDLRSAGTRIGLSTYSFDLVVTAPGQVPEPATGLLVAGSLLALGATRARRRRA